ncbi:MAG TPA: phage holin family protein [Steroidobacteraceae bacterium]|nr:phage holin family protein [Steroidobacteraceae bacterium]
MNDGAQPIIARGKSLLDQLLRIAQTRLELLSMEIEQEKINVTRELRLAAAIVICAWLAGFTLVLWVALVLPPRPRFIVLGVLFVLFLLGGIVSWIVLRRSLRRAPLFSRVVDQLRLDRASLGNEP